MAETIRDFFQREGVPLTAGGNTPIPLNTPDHCWYVDSGQVEVFTVAFRNGAPEGGRHHYLTIHSGEVMFGVGAVDGLTGRGLLAVGHPDTGLYRAPLAAFRRLAASDEHRESAARLLDAWITRISAAVSRDINPRTDQLLQAGVPVELRPGSSVRSLQGVVWVETRNAPPLVYLDMEELPAAAGASPFFPLTQDARLSAPQGGSLRSVSTGEAIGRDGCWEGLNCFYELVFRCEDMNRRLSSADDLNRIRDRQEWDRHTAEETFQEFRTVITRRRPAFDAHAATEPLLAVSRMIGHRSGLEIRKPPEWQHEQEGAGFLLEIARASRIRIRPVRLGGAWFRTDHGDLAGFLKEGSKPVALLQRAPGIYEIHDPVSRQVTRVTAADATRLASPAYMFYRPLPPGPLRIRDLFRFGLHRGGRDILILLAMAAAGGLMTAMIPLFTRFLFNTVLPGADRAQLLFIPVALICSALGFLSFQLNRNFANLRLLTRMDVQIQAALMDRLLRLPLTFFRQYSAGDLSVRVTGLAAIWPFLSSMFALVLFSLFTGLFNTAMMMSFDGRLGLTGIGLILGAVIPSAVYWRLQAGHLKAVTVQEGKLAGVVLQLLTGIAKIRSAGAEVHAFAIWGRVFCEMRRRKIEALLHSVWFQTFSRSFPLLCQIVLFWAMGSILLSRPIFPASPPVSTGDFLAFVAAFTNVLAVTLGIAAVSAQAGMIAPVLDRVRPILAALPEVDESKQDPGKLAGAIEVSRLSYRYRPELPLVLHDLSFSIRPGEFVAIVGTSGSGKSTLLRLLLGFDQPESGSVLYDGRDLNRLDLSSLRRQIGTVMQNGRPMPGSILDNIRGSRPLTPEQCWEAIRLAGLEQDIRELPMGVHSVISSGGSVFSGGQVQRMLIARALAPKPRLLFFDEATSALDNRTQAQIGQSLRDLQATRLVIAHRLSTIVHADRVIVLDQGQKVQEGSFQELIRQPGPFAELARRQTLDPDGNLAGYMF